MAKNERKTENIVRDELKKHGFDPTYNIKVEEQKSDIEDVKALMKSASNSGGTGGGSPEFIISSPSSPDFLLIIECKADVKDHISPVVTDILNGTAFIETDDAKAKRTKRCAVDGILHYAKSLSKKFNVISIAISG